MLTSTDSVTAHECWCINLTRSRASSLWQAVDIQQIPPDKIIRLYTVSHVVAFRYSHRFSNEFQISFKHCPFLWLYPYLKTKKDGKCRFSWRYFNFVDTTLETERNNLGNYTTQASASQRDMPSPSLLTHCRAQRPILFEEVKAIGQKNIMARLRVIGWKQVDRHTQRASF